MDIMDSIRMAAGRPSAATQESTEESVCGTCNGEGSHMDMRCYGGPPVEVRVWCVDCGGRNAGDPV